MKTIVIGAGVAGLTAAYRLLQKGHEVVILEKNKDPGGLAMGFKKKEWDWSLEKGYHHWFTNDNAILNLTKKIGHPVQTILPKTNVYIRGKILQFDSPLSVLTFAYLSPLAKIRLAILAMYLKAASNYKQFENITALDWLNKYMGRETTSAIWVPLLKGKFGKEYANISMTWFWARIKKRTQKLVYPEGGLAGFIDSLTQAVEGKGGKIKYATEVKLIEPQKQDIRVKTNNKVYRGDKVLVTLQSPIFSKMSPKLKDTYKKRLEKIKYYDAQIMVLVLSKPFMKDTYWLNILEKDFPFLVLVDHTNFINKKHYNGDNLLYIGNYLPHDHKYFKMDKKELLKEFDPYLNKINSNYSKSIKDSYLFNLPFAQPIVSLGYQKHIPKMKTPLKNVYLASMDMVYPWDRGTNYAVEMGEKAAEMLG